MKKTLEQFFKIREHQTSLRTEILAGLTTFFTMAYVVLINPAILSSSGMPVGALFVATCLTAATGSLLVGLFANFPIAIAPSMGLNAYFAYVIVKDLGYSWETALGFVFISGILFFILTVSRLRQKILQGIPFTLNIATCGGIGLLLALIALKGSGIIVPNASTILSLGTIDRVQTLLFLFGFCLIIFLDHRQMPGALLISIVVTTLIGLLLGVNHFYGVISMPPDLSPTLMHFSLKNMLNQQAFIIIFTFFLIALFDSAGTFIGLLQQTNIEQNFTENKKLSKALLIDSMTTMVGACLGTSTSSPYVESASGIRAGGRTGLTAIIVAICFLLALFFSPLTKTIPFYATGPALLFVAFLMVKEVIKIDWSDLTEFIPGIITLTMIPFTFSIADGIGIGFIAYTLIKTLCGKYKELSLMAVIISIIFFIFFCFKP